MHVDASLQAKHKDIIAFVRRTAPGDGVRQIHQGLPDKLANLCLLLLRGGQHPWRCWRQAAQATQPAAYHGDRRPGQGPGGLHG